MFESFYNLEQKISICFKTLKIGKNIAPESGGVKNIICIFAM